jgi:D-lactate dehydrogenase (quinone)
LTLDAALSAESVVLVRDLRAAVGRRHVLCGAAAEHHLTGYREGQGDAVAVVKPGNLVELWRVFRACIAADHVVIAQAANTGLTGGSTPFGTYDRPVVVVNTMRIHGIHLIREARQVVCLAGATLDRLEQSLAPHGREPHSVIGSSCLGASVIGGVCNNSGGSLVSRGPAYTRLSLFAQVDDRGEVRLHNHLGIDLGDEPEAMLARLERREFDESDIAADDALASARDYPDVVRDCAASTPARYNNDPARLFETAGCAGKLLVFAVRLDTYPAEVDTATFYAGTNDPASFTAIRRRMLRECDVLPISAEYIHREAFDLAERYGKDTVVAIQRLGTHRLPRLFAAKAWVDRLSRKLGIAPGHLSDRVLQFASSRLPDHLPSRIRAFRDRYEHHLIVKVTARERPQVASLLDEELSEKGGVFACSPEEAKLAFLHRFAVAGAAVRYRAVHPDRIEDILALDIALRRNDGDWADRLAPEIEARLVGKIYYGHFLCHVFHRDYLVAKGNDVAALKELLLAELDERGAEYPAEHNVGHIYRAKPALAAHYRKLDPGNALNPGLGKTSRKRNWHRSIPRRVGDLKSLARPRTSPKHIHQH